MKIVFNGKNCGYGNNGGSRTLVLCSSVLDNLGAEVVLYGPYKYKWSEKPKNVTIIENGKIPTSDVIIATGQASVPSTLAHKRCKKRYWWVRGHEIWSTSESQLNEYYKSIPCLTNSWWIHRHIIEVAGGQSTIQYQGVDYDLWSNDNSFEERKIDIGGLYSSRHKTKNHYILEELEKKYDFNVKMLNRDIKDPNFKQLKDWYNDVKIWVATSTLEGLHNPPLEAGLCGCPVICNTHTRNGMFDYDNSMLKYGIGWDGGDSIDEGTERPVDAIARHVNYWLENPDKAKESNLQLQNDIKKKIGSREENMKKMLEIFRREM